MTDPTRNERQRLYRARRKAEAEGKVEVTVAETRYWVPVTVATRIERMCREAENATVARRG